MKCEGIDLIACGGGESLEQQKSILPTPRESNQLFVNMWQEIGEHPAIASDAKLMHGWLEALLFWSAYPILLMALYRLPSLISERVINVRCTDQLPVL
jgi:hypothetical protein